MAGARPGDAAAGFGRYGQVALPMIAAVSGVAELPDGRVAVAGAAPSGTPTVVMLDATGRPDSRFGSHGVISVKAFERPGYVASTADGDLLLVGHSKDYFTTYVAAIRKDGQLDPAFGDGDGVARIGDSVLLGHVDVDHQGRIVLFGGSPGAVRLLPDGRPDPSWNGNGRAQVPAGFEPLDGGIGPGDRVFLTGNTDTQRGAVYLTGAGGPDTTYADHGFAPVGGPYEAGGTRAVATADGGLFLAWNDCSRVTGNCRPRGARVDAGGALNPGFGPGGTRVAGSFRPLARGNGAVTAGGPTTPSQSGRHGSGPAATDVLELIRGSGVPSDVFGYQGFAYVYAGRRATYIEDVAAATRGDVLVTGEVLHGGEPTHGFVARFVGRGGSSGDADADGRRDSRDRCPVLAGDRHRGCPKLARRRLSLTASPRGLRGRLRSKSRECATGVALRVIRRHRGNRRVIAHPKVDRRGAWAVKRKLRAGAYRARLGGTFPNGAGYCGPASSRTRRLGS